MNFSETPLRGSYVLDIEKIEDKRGFFARSFCQKEFAIMGLNPCIAQCNISFNSVAGTLRGMHYQISPHAETKIVTCITGAIFDVIIDLRSDSCTYLQWFGIELSGDNYRLLYVPQGFAHGFQTLVDNTTVHYQISEFYNPESARGIRWDDPVFNISWPQNDNRILSDKDASYPLFR